MTPATANGCVSREYVDRGDRENRDELREHGQEQRVALAKIDEKITAFAVALGEIRTQQRMLTWGGPIVLTILLGVIELTILIRG